MSLNIIVLRFTIEESIQFYLFILSRSFFVVAALESQKGHSAKGTKKRHSTMLDYVSQSIRFENLLVSENMTNRSSASVFDNLFFPMKFVNQYKNGLIYRFQMPIDLCVRKLFRLLEHSRWICILIKSSSNERHSKNFITFSTNFRMYLKRGFCIPPYDTPRAVCYLLFDAFNTWQSNMMWLKQLQAS